MSRLRIASCKLPAGMVPFIVSRGYVYVLNSTFYTYTVQNDTIEVPGGTNAWTYQGNSFSAFSDDNSYDAAYLGPFDGHINGALIMKELQL